MIEYIIIKMPQEEIPEYSNSVKIFASMNIEEYLYSLKFEEIADKVSEAKRRRWNKFLLIVAAIVVVAVVVYVTYETVL